MATRDWLRSPFQAAQEDAIDKRIADLEKELEEVQKEARAKRLSAMLHPRKPMTSEQQEELVERLYGTERSRKSSSRREMRATPMKEAQRLTAEEQEELNNRLYYEQLDHLEEREETRQQELSGSIIETSQLEKDELDAFVQRMYDQERDRRSAKLDELRSKYLVETSPTKKRLSKKGREDLVRRMYTEGKARQEQKLQAAMDTFLAQPAKSGRKLNKSEVAAVAERLYRTAKG